MPEQDRLEKINSVLKQELSQAILRELDFGGKVFITVTRIDTSRNLSQSKVFVSVAPEKETEKALRALNSQSHNFHQVINKKMRIRKIPKFFFIEDKELKKAQRMDELLREVEERNRE